MSQTPEKKDPKVDVTRTAFTAAIANALIANFGLYCWDLGDVPARQEIHDDDITAYWDKGLVAFGLGYLNHALGRDEETLFAFHKALTLHELGHALLLWEVPGTILNMVKDHQHVDALCKKKWKRGQVADFLNIVYDTIDDVLGYQQFQADITLVEEILRGQAEAAGKVSILKSPDYEPGTEKVSEWLHAFRQAATREAFSPYICEEIQQASYEALRIIAGCFDNRMRAQKICDLLYPLFKEEFDKDAEKINKILKALGVGTPQTAEMGDEGEIMDSLVQQDEKTKEVAKELLGQIMPGVSINWALAELWEEAGKKVKFRLSITSKTPGEEMRVGDVTWVPGMPLRDLDVETTVKKYGKAFLPGVTTQRAFSIPGPGKEVPSPKPNRIKVCCDVSGSMANRPTSMALFTMIREAERRNIPVAVNTFANSVVTFEGFTKDYFGLAKQIHAGYSEAGGGNSVSGLEKSDDLRAGDLLLYITDFGLPECSQEQATTKIRELTAIGVQVVFIAMFEHHDAAVSGLSYTECFDIEDLSSKTLTAAT